MKYANFLSTISISLFYFCKKVFALMNIWIIGKNLMEYHYFFKKIFLKLPEYVRYYWRRLHTNFRRTYWFVCSKRYIIVSRCIWELPKYVSWNIWTWPCLFPYCIRIRMVSSDTKDQNKIRPINWYRYVLMVEKGVRGGICQAIH